MLRARYIRNADGAAHYFSEGPEGGVALWYGADKERLGLPDEVTPEHLARVLHGLHPITGEKMTPRRRSDAIGGFEVMLSVPKSVSALIELHPDPTQREAAERAALQAALEVGRSIESHLVVVDQRGGKKTRRNASGGLYGAFLHHTSRPVDGTEDFNWHVHLVFAPFALDPERGRYMAPDFEPVRSKADRYETDFHQLAMQNLYREGFPLRQSGKYFEIAGVPDSLLASFSRRKAQVDKRAKELGLTTGRQRHNLAAATRSGKNESGKTLTELRAGWKAMLQPGEEYLLSHLPEQHPRPSAGRAAHWAAHFHYRGKPKAKLKDMVDRAVSRGLGRVTQEEAKRQIERLQIPTKRGWCNLATWRRQLARKAWAFMDSLHQRDYNREVHHAYPQRLDGRER